METVLFLTQIASAFTGISAAFVLIIKPLRERLTGAKKYSDGMKCMLRSDMLRMYYKHREEKQIRQYEYENFELEYQAYKSMKGNSFIDRIHQEVHEWEVVS